VGCGAGNDVILGGTNADAIDGGDGDDFIMGSAGSDSINGDSLGLINGIQFFFDGRDVIFGGSGDDRIAAGGYMDIIHDRIGANRIDGEFGYDWHTYYESGVKTGVYADLGLLVPPVGNIFAGALDTHRQVEGLSGGAGNDQLFGDARIDLLVPPAVAIPAGAVAAVAARRRGAGSAHAGAADQRARATEPCAGDRYPCRGVIGGRGRTQRRTPEPDRCT
jgi:Ca2+-binding RTX toxin-like protein